MKLLFLLGLLAVSLSAQPVNTTGKGLGELLNEINNLEDDLMKTVFNDIKGDLKDAAKNKKALEEAAINALANKAGEFKQKLSDALNKFNEAKDAAAAKIEEERQKLIEEYKAKLAEKKAAKEAEKKEAKEKFDKFTKEVKEKLEAKKAEMEQKRQELKAKLDELAQTVKENREARKAEKEARKAEEKQERDAFVESIKSQLQSLDEEKKMLSDNYDAFKQKEDELRKQIKDAFGSSFKDAYAEGVEDYLQNKLEQEYIKRGVSEIINPAKEADKIDAAAAVVEPAVRCVGSKTDSANGAVVEPDVRCIGNQIPVGPGPVVQAVPKASLIDQLTGKSSWETVAWVLLALCIVLAIALIALIIFQVKNSGAKNGNYERLDGHNEGGEKQGLLAGNPKKSKTSGAGGYTDMDQPSGSAPPSAPADEAKEQQQF